MFVNANCRPVQRFRGTFLMERSVYLAPSTDPDLYSDIRRRLAVHKVAEVQSLPVNMVIQPGIAEKNKLNPDKMTVVMYDPDQFDSTKVGSFRVSQERKALVETVSRKWKFTWGSLGGIPYPIFSREDTAQYVDRVLTKAAQMAKEHPDFCLDSVPNNKELDKIKAVFERRLLDLRFVAQ
jgi:hypothetical protein